MSQEDSFLEKLDKQTFLSCFFGSRKQLLIRDKPVLVHCSLLSYYISDIVIKAKSKKNCSFYISRD